MPRPRQRLLVHLRARPSWSDDPDDWEAARAALAHIIDGQ